MEDGGATSSECFLCSPNSRWVWQESDRFFAMVALGPVVEGMSIVATRNHIRSMFDVPIDLMGELEIFTRSACRRLEARFQAPVHVTEHGRVGLCEWTNGRHDQHCYHAHRLLFPTQADIARALDASTFAPVKASSFEDARRIAGHLTEYLYYEGPDGSVLVGTTDGQMPRQFFRSAVADAIKRPELRSWRMHPQVELLDAAAVKLLAQ
jgi:hypothetical protein